MSATRNRLVPALALPLTLVSALVLSGCGLFGPTTYEVDERSIEVGAGDEFTLSVPASPGQGQSWFLATPHPDRAVVRLTAQDEEVEGSELDGGADGTQFFDFKAVEPGTTKIKLLHCPLGSCDADVGDPAPLPSHSESPFPTATATPGLDPEYFIYTVTVR
ncbi:protease inhibitor I42 family protein [Streptomyces sp. ISL-100]|uniref:protease inhibitor I42 family protein n=1 Tax=Streptomyces sp. ISL-100 TaxID=2819173 RepID=UPI001BE6A694|nr:protease inhibitor I42 family protein [Streptomyces sp. ISL-100]MBT2400525.1 protease inhibitor I42 family protein [Streptomyces sp. ISL-100]